MIRPTVWAWRAHCAAADSHGFVLPLHQTCHCGSRSAGFHYLTGSAGPLPLPAAICTPKTKKKRILQQSLRGVLSHAQKHIAQALTVCLVFQISEQSSEWSSSLQPSAKTHFASLFWVRKSQTAHPAFKVTAAIEAMSGNLERRKGHTLEERTRKHSHTLTSMF